MSFFIGSFIFEIVISVRMLRSGINVSLVRVSFLLMEVRVFVIDGVMVFVEFEIRLRVNEVFG